MKIMLLISLLLSFATQYPMKENSELYTIDNCAFFYENQIPLFKQIMQELLSHKTVNIKKPIILRLCNAGPASAPFDANLINFGIGRFHDGKLSQKDQKELYKYVIAHELSHIERERLSAIKMIAYMLAGGGLMIGTAMYFHDGDHIGAIIGLISLTTLCYLINNIGPKEEKKCDMRAMELCGTNKGALLACKFFRQREKEFYQAQPSSIVTKFQKLFKTHPSAKERKKYIKNWNPKNK